VIANIKTIVRIVIWEINEGKCLERRIMKSAGGKTTVAWQTVQYESFVSQYLFALEAVQVRF